MRPHERRLKSCIVVDENQYLTPRLIQSPIPGGDSTRGRVGNYPDRVSLEGALFDSDDAVSNSSPEWTTLLPESKLKMDQQHYFDDELVDIGAVSHVRVSIYPDGGISRVRLFGQVDG